MAFEASNETPKQQEETKITPVVYLIIKSLSFQKSFRVMVKWCKFMVSVIFQLIIYIFNMYKSYVGIYNHVSFI